MANRFKSSIIEGYLNADSVLLTGTTHSVRTMNANEVCLSSNCELICVNGFNLVKFPNGGSVGEEGVISFVKSLPPSYLEGTDIKMSIRWVSPTVFPGNVVWTMSYSWVNCGESITPLTAMANLGANPENSLEVTSTKFTDISGVGKLKRSLIFGKLERKSSLSSYDTYNNDVYLIEVCIGFQIYSLGDPEFIP